MLPPVSTSQPSLKGVPAPEASVRADLARGDAIAQTKVVRPELPTAIDAARRAAGLERVKEETGERGQLPGEATPPDDAPTGPPPTFEETPLQRQSRLAFDPPKFEPLGSETASTDRVSDILPMEAKDDDALTPSQPTRGAAEFTAARGFAEARVDFSATTVPEVDQSA